VGPTVDVLIAARDRADTIERAVTSALAEAEVGTVIVVDDGSTDDTAARARKCDADGKRLVVKRLASNVGPSAARNIALGMSDSAWVAILDGDDFFLPGRIGDLLKHADGWDFIADNQSQVFEDRPDIAPSPRTFVDPSLGPQAIDLVRFVLGNITRRGRLRDEFGFIKPIIRRSFLSQNSLRYDESLRLGEDYALYARALAAGARFLLVPNAGYVSTVRKTSLSARHDRRDLERLRDINCALAATETLTARERQALAAHYRSVDCRVQWVAVIEGFKKHNILQFLAPFGRSPQVAAYLLEHLAGEVIERSKKAYRGRAIK
jgi:succinoglycan biosynthesis protein ExoU